MSTIPNNLKYTQEHEWALIEGDTATIGITDFAQSALGDIVYVELPDVGDSLDKEATFGVVESIKSVSDLYSPVSGEVVDVNRPLVDTPETCNHSPYDDGWMIKIKLSDVSQLDSLMNAKQYQDFCAQQ